MNRSWGVRSCFHPAWRQHSIRIPQSPGLSPEHIWAVLRVPECRVQTWAQELWVFCSLFTLSPHLGGLNSHCWGCQLQFPAAISRALFSQCRGGSRGGLWAGLGYFCPLGAPGGAGLLICSPWCSHNYLLLINSHLNHDLILTIEFYN